MRHALYDAKENDWGVFELGWLAQKFDFSEKSNFFALNSF
jgi:hypothetical protein